MEKLFKIIIIGDPTVGKTSYIQRYVHQSYQTDYKGTIGGMLKYRFSMHVMSKYCIHANLDITKVNITFNICTINCIRTYYQMIFELIFKNRVALRTDDMSHSVASAIRKVTDVIE